MERRTLRIILDVTILVLVPLLYNSRVLSPAFHEIAGLAVLLLLGMHLLLNWKWITGVVTSWARKGLPRKTRFTYVLDLTLWGSFLFAGISGLSISRVLLSGTRDPLWRNLHFFSSALALLLFGLHIGLHISAIAGVFRKLWPLHRRTVKVLNLAILIILVIVGTYSLFRSPLVRWLTAPFSTIDDRRGHTVLAENHPSPEHREIFPQGERRGQGQGLRRNADPTRHFRVANDALPKTIATFVTYGSIVGVLAVATRYLLIPGFLRS